MRASNIEVLSALTRLRMLSFGVFELEATDLLALLDPNSMQELAIGETRSGRIDLTRINDFQRLELLRVSAHCRGIESVGGIKGLRKLWLNSIPRRQRLGFVSSLPVLRDLYLILGGRDDIAEVKSESVEILEIIRVKGFASFPDLNRFPELRSLRIEDQLRLTDIQIAAVVHSKLASLSLINCKKLSRLDGIANLEQLEGLRISRTALDYDALLAGPLPRSLDIVALYTGSARRNKELRARLDDLGFREFTSR